MKKYFSKSLEEMADDELYHLLKNDKNVNDQQRYKIKHEIRLREKLKNIANPNPPIKTINSEVLEAGLNKLDNKLQKIKDSIVYGNFVYVCSLLYILALFVSFENEFTQAIFDFFVDLLMIIIFTFTYLWIRKRILLFSLLFYMIYWNIAILSNPIIQSTVDISDVLYIDEIDLVFSLISLLCLFLGLTNKFKHRYFTREIGFNIKQSVGLILGISIVFQVVIRII